MSNQIYIQDLDSFNQKNQRINGYKELSSVGARTTKIYIINDTVFRYYLENKQFPLNFENQLLEIAKKLQKDSNTNSLVVRRAYVVPGIENPPGPRLLGLSLNQVIDGVKQLYDFAIENKYHVHKNSKIVVFIYPFVDPKPLTLPIKFGTPLPYGGYAYPLNKEATRVEILAVWGNNDGVQSLGIMDKYTVDTTRPIIIKKDTPQKSLMWCTTKKSQAQKLSVPSDKQFEQILNDLEILEIGRIVKELKDKYGLRRIEFSYDGIKELGFNESAKFDIYENQVNNFDKKGFIKIVSSQKEIDEVKQFDNNKISNTIVYIDKKIIENRQYDLLNIIAGLPFKLTILYPSLSATAHAMRVLNDFGHTALVVGNKDFKNGEEILIKVVSGEISIENLSQSNIKKYLTNLYDAQLFGLEIVGGKANNLSILKSKGFNVPHGWVITTNFCDNKTDKIWQDIQTSINLNPNKLYAVRSSATVEDQKEHSFAGQFATYLNVKTDKIKDKVIAVINSTRSRQVISYQKAMKMDKPIKMAVVIQEMVDVAKSGVIFGKDIQTGNEDFIVIDVAKGLCEGVVDGIAKTQRIYYSRNKNQIINQTDGEIKSVLNKIEIGSLIEMTNSVERLMGGIQDIEWAIDKNNNIWVVQSRDL